MDFTQLTFSFLKTGHNTIFNIWLKKIKWIKYNKKYNKNKIEVIYQLELRRTKMDDSVYTVSSLKCVSMLFKSC